MFKVLSDASMSDTSSLSRNCKRIHRQGYCSQVPVTSIPKQQSTSNTLQFLNPRLLNSLVIRVTTLDLE